MANKRNLKKGINFICDNLVAECFAIAIYNSNNAKTEMVDDTIASILQMHRDYINRISHPEPGMPQKTYFKVLKTDFIQSVNEVIDNIKNIG